MKKINIIAFLTLFFLFTSCVPQKDIVYFQGNQSFKNNSLNFEPLVQYDDLLYIYVSSMEPEAATPFNLESQSDTGVTTNSFPVQKQTYLVDNFGNIEYPVIGTINVAGYTLSQLKSIIKEKLSVYIKNPVINIRIMNFKVSVIGEVSKPSTINVSTQRITLPEALSMAGDLTIYGKRDNILLIRDFQGVKTYNRIDITSADFVNSPFYYLDQNDVIYVQPRKAKANSTAISSNVTTIVSIFGSLLAASLILTR